MPSTEPLAVKGLSRATVFSPKALLVALNREPTDEEIRRLHDNLRHLTDGSLPEQLVPHAAEWYELCERRFAVDRISISGDLAQAIVDAVSFEARRPDRRQAEAP